MTRRWTLLLLLLLPATASADAGDRDADEDGWTENEGDCDDSRADTWPGAIEVCFDGIDQDCTGDPDDACMGVSTKTIRIVAGATTTTWSVSYPSDADETLAFLAVNQVVEQSNDQCDYSTTITDQSGSYSFSIDLQHCGTGMGNTYGFEAEAVVLSRIGGPGGFTWFDLSTLPPLDATHTTTSSATLGGEDPDLQLCSVFSSDGQGDIDHNWACSAGVSAGQLDGSLYENEGNAGTFNEARIANIGLGRNLAVTKHSFSCNNGSTDTISHTVSEADDHTAWVLPEAWNADDEIGFSSSCSYDSSTGSNTCTLSCLGSGSGVSGVVLFVDGDFE